MDWGKTMSPPPTPSVASKMETGNGNAHAQGQEKQSLSQSLHQSQKQTRSQIQNQQLQIKAQQQETAQTDPDITPPTTVHPKLQTPPPQSITTAVPSNLADSPATTPIPGRPAMIFSDIYKSPRSPIAKIRHQSVQLSPEFSTSAPDWVAEEYADLLSKDKTKQKEAVKRYLADKVKNDWEFQWPSRVVETIEDKDGVRPASVNDVTQNPAVESTDAPEPVQDETREDPGYQVDEESESDLDDDDDAQSVYSTVSEDRLRYKPRLEWASDLSDDEQLPVRSPFRFDSPDTVGSSIHENILTKRAKRRRAVREEMKWNEGLACFEARRNAWTGARTVRVRPKPVTPPALSPRSPRRFFFRRSMSSSPPTSSDLPTQAQAGEASDGSSLRRSDDKDLRKQQTRDSVPLTPPDTRDYTIETLCPIGQPILPPNNPLRASITPSVYLSLYEKVIIHNLQPSCPINLADMLRSCVAGWKRDGEWPPRATMAPAPVARKKKKQPKPEAVAKDKSGSNFARRMSFGLLGREKDDEAAAGKGIRQSLQRALGLGVNGTQEASTPTHAPTPAPPAA